MFCDIIQFLQGILFGKILISIDAVLIVNCQYCFSVIIIQCL